MSDVPPTGPAATSAAQPFDDDDARASALWQPDAAEQAFPRAWRAAGWVLLSWSVGFLVASAVAQRVPNTGAGTMWALAVVVGPISLGLLRRVRLARGVALWLVAGVALLGAGGVANDSVAVGGLGLAVALGWGLLLVGRPGPRRTRVGTAMSVLMLALFVWGQGTSVYEASRFGAVGERWTWGDGRVELWLHDWAPYALDPDDEDRPDLTALFVHPRTKSWLRVYCAPLTPGTDDPHAAVDERSRAWARDNDTALRAPDLPTVGARAATAFMRVDEDAFSPRDVGVAVVADDDAVCVMELRARRPGKKAFPPFAQDVFEEIRLPIYREPNRAEDAPAAAGERDTDDADWFSEGNVPDARSGARRGPR